MGLKTPREKCLRELNEVISEFSSNYEHHFDKLLLRLPEEDFRGINPACLIAAGVVAYHETKFRQLSAYNDAYEVLRILSKTGLILGIITAGLQVKQAEKLIRLKLYQYLHPRAIFISDQIGISKPNKKLFQRACSEMKVPPQEAMYIGDNPINDIDPPNAIGMITAWSRRSGKYASVKGKTRPLFEIDNFWDLLRILKDHFGIHSPES